MLQKRRIAIKGQKRAPAKKPRKDLCLVSMKAANQYQRLLDGGYYTNPAHIENIKMFIAALKRGHNTFFILERGSDEKQSDGKPVSALLITNSSLKKPIWINEEHTATPTEFKA